MTSDSLLGECFRKRNIGSYFLCSDHDEKEMKIFMEKKHKINLFRKKMETELCEWIVGPSGCGKTYYVLEKYAGQIIPYDVRMEPNDTRLDGKVVFMDDAFNVSNSNREKCNKQVEFLKTHLAKVVVTSQFVIDEVFWYLINRRNDWEMIKRRFTVIHMDYTEEQKRRNVGPCFGWDDDNLEQNTVDKKLMTAEEIQIDYSIAVELNELRTSDEKGSSPCDFCPVL